MLPCFSLQHIPDLSSLVPWISGLGGNPSTTSSSAHLFEGGEKRRGVKGQKGNHRKVSLLYTSLFAHVYEVKFHFRDTKTEALGK